MVKRKRWLGIMLVALSIVLLLAACSGSSTESPNTKNNEPDTTDESATDPGAPEVRGSLVSAIYDRGGVPAEEGTIEDNRWTKWINENGPADVTFAAIPRWESIQKYNVLFASGSAPDIIYEYDTSYRNTLITQRQLLPIQDLIAEHSTEYKALMEKFPILKQVATKPDGNMYEFGRVNGLNINHTLWIRKDWLDQVGLQIPQTTEELFEVAMAFTNNDPDNNGQNDTYGIAISFVTGLILDHMFQSSDLHRGYKVQDETLVKVWENAEAATAFKKRLYDAGLTDKDFLADANGEKSKQDFITGKLGIYGVNGGGDSKGFAVYEALKQNIPDAEVIAIPLPASQFGQFSPIMGNPVQMTTVVNANAKDPVAVMKYIDFLVKEDTQRTLYYGNEGEHYQLGANGCPVDLDVEKNKVEHKWNVDFHLLVSAELFGDCKYFKTTLNPEIPVQKEFMDIIDQSFEAYLSPERPIAEYTHSEHMPSPPEDLLLIQTTAVDTLKSYIDKAIVGGNSYTAVQAIADAKAYWEQSGGTRVDEWYAQWYAENKDTALLAEDLYQVK